MDEMLQDPMIQEKVKKLSPSMKDAFLKAMESLYDKETAVMMAVLSNSRSEVNQTGAMATRDMEELKDVDDMDKATQQRYMETSRSAATEYVKAKRAKEQKNVIMTAEDEINSKPLPKKKNKNKANTLDVPKPSAPASPRPKSPRSSRRVSPTPPRTPSDMERGSLASLSSSLTLPGTPESSKSLEEQKDELLENLRGSVMKMENERERQKQLIEQRKEAQKSKKQNNEDAANELLEQAASSEKAKAKEKERQEQMIKDKLQKKKKNADS